MPLKATDKPQFSKKWWTSGKPADIKGVELEKALAAVEKALAEEKKKSGQESIEAACAALEALESAVDKTISKECDKKKHKDLITVLDKFEGLIKDEMERLDEAQEALPNEAGGDEEADEDEEDEGKLFEKDYLYKMIKLMRSSGKTLNFGFGLNTNAPEASQLLLKRKGKPELLFKALKRTGNYSNRCLVCGTALADPENAKVLLLRVEEGDEPPQILKLGRKFLRADKTLKFRKLKVVINGKTLEDGEPDEEEVQDVATAGGANLNSQLAKIENLMQGWKKTCDDVGVQISRVCQAIERQNDPALNDVGKALRNVVKQLPDLDLSKLAEAARANDSAAYNRTLQQTLKEVNEAEAVLKGPLLSTIDENPFVTTKVHATVDAFMSQLKSELRLGA